MSGTFLAKSEDGGFWSPEFGMRGKSGLAVTVTEPVEVFHVAG
jgi:hypothetical protein